MVPKVNRRKIIINITTFNKEEVNFNSIKKFQTKNMNPKNDKRPNDSKRFICSICLNANGSFKKEIENTNSCQKCRKYCPLSEPYANYQAKERDMTVSPRLYHKNVQTLNTDFTEDVNLLKEVLTVFRSKKQIGSNDKTASTRDIAVSTDDKSIFVKAKLARSKVFQYSVQDCSRQNDESKFEILCRQPDYSKLSQLSINLAKIKSSSIPQMKMEELKQSHKEKSKPKDAIEEVHRMFATVGKFERTTEDSNMSNNRPVVRNGPRVLPVVKTAEYEGSNQTHTYSEDKTNNDCSCCQTSRQMSGGDSYKCCHDKSNRYVYTMCCRYQKQQKVDTAPFICDCCNKKQ